VVKFELEATDLSADSKEGKKTFSSVKEINKKVKILKTGNNKIIKFELFYAKADEKTKADKEESIRTEPAAGKTYIITVKDASIDTSMDIIYPDNKRPVYEEINFINSDFTNINALLYNSDYLTEKEIKLEERVPELEKAVVSKLSDSFNMEKGIEAEIIMKGIRKIGNADYGVFSVKAKIISVQEEYGLTITMDLKGELLIQANNCNKFKLHFEGPISVVQKDENSTKTGKGTVLFDDIFE
jgi:hypothetical protein